MKKLIKKSGLGIAVAMLVLMIMVALGGCGGSGSSVEGERLTVFTDDLGREIIVKEIPRKIVSISPATTEILFALGLNDEIVGVTEYCDYPEEALAKEKIGTFTTPNLEAILALEPDLVLATGGVQLETLDRMEELGMVVYAVNPTTFDQTVETIREVGEITGTADRADEIALDMEERAALIEDRVKESEAQGKPRPRVFYEIFYETNVWTAGMGSVISDLITRAGGRNIGDMEASDYYEFSVERLIAENPQVYLVGSGSMFNPGDITQRSGWDRMDAVSNGRVYVVDENLVYRTGPRLIEGLEDIHEALYP